jgi:hypothetical protein
MPSVTFHAFISCSFAEEDADLLDTFKRLIRSFGIEPDVYDYQELGRIPDKVKEYILRADCLIALATRRKKLEGSDLWACGDWIHHEVALANAYRKPIAIFAEDGVRIEGLLETEERRQRFSRSHLLRDIDKITRFLFSLRGSLEDTYSQERLHLPVLLRHYLHVKEEVRSRDLAIIRSDILMESLIDGLEATFHSNELEETTPGLTVRPKQFDFVCKEIPSGKRAEPFVLQDSDQKYLWRLNFHPPLAKGDKVKYAFKLQQQNIRPWTHEEAEVRVTRATYEYKDPRCEACEWTITYPTAEFCFDLEFPEGYEIRDPWLDVRMGEARLPAEHELTRLKEGNMFTAEKVIDKWSLSLRIPKPLQGHTYHIFYFAPSERELHEGSTAKS